MTQMDAVLLLLVWNELPYKDRVEVLKRGLPGRAIYDAQQAIRQALEHKKCELFYGVTR